MKRLLLFVLFLLPTILMKAQTGGVSIGKECQIAHVKAILDIVSDSKGLLIPRLTTSQRNKMYSNEDYTSKSLLVFDVDFNSFMYWTGKEWESLAKGSNTIIEDNLNSDSKFMSLSARQGKILKDMLEAEILDVNDKLKLTIDTLSVQRNDISKNYKDILMLNKSLYVNVDSLMAHRVDINKNRLKSDEQIGINANAIKSNSDAIYIVNNDLQLEIDNIQFGCGFQETGVYIANPISSFIKTAVSLKDADDKLDIQLKINSEAIVNNTQKISENLASITANGTGLSLAKTNIADNSAKITTNSTLIYSNSESINQNKTDLQKEIDATQKGSGLDLMGGYIANANCNYIKTAVSLKDADEKLDFQLKINSETIANNVDVISKNLAAITTNETGLSLVKKDIVGNAAKITINSASISDNSESIHQNKIELQKEIDATQKGSGLDLMGGYTANANCNYIKTAVSLKDADEKLDFQLKTNADILGSNSNKIIQNAANIAGNVDAIANNTNKINQNLTAIAVNETGLSMAEIDINNNMAKIASNSVSISSNNNAISNNTIGISENALEITANKTSLLTVNAKITANSLGIVANKTSITALSESFGRSIGDLQKELDDTQIGTGLEVDGSYLANDKTSYLKDAISLKDADNKLDKRISKNELSLFYGYIILQNKINKVKLGSGLEEGGYNSNENCNYIKTASSLKDADDKLDAQVKINADAIKGKADAVILPQAGDMQYFDGTSWKRLPKGTEGQVLVMGNDIPKWSDVLKEFYNKLKEYNDAIVLIPKKIGDSFGGGKIAYINTGNETDALGIEPGHGLVVVDMDISNEIQWHSGNYVETGANSDTDGKSNTQKIILELGTGLNYPALLSAECSVGGYDDWYLPSKEELNLLYLNKDILGGFSSSAYWSSSEFSELNAWSQDFSNGYQANADKSSSGRVRCVRRF